MRASDGPSTISDEMWQKLDREVRERGILTAVHDAAVSVEHTPV